MKVVPAMGPTLGPIVFFGLVIAGCGSSESSVADGASPDASVDAAWPWLGKEEAGAGDVAVEVDAAAPVDVVDAGVDHVQPAAYDRPSYTHLAETGYFSAPGSLT